MNVCFSPFFSLLQKKNTYTPHICIVAIEYARKRDRKRKKPQLSENDSGNAELNAGSSTDDSYYSSRKRESVILKETVAEMSSRRKKMMAEIDGFVESSLGTVKETSENMGSVFSTSSTDVVRRPNERIPSKSTRSFEEENSIES